MANSNIQKPQTIVIFWDGPFTVEEVKKLDRTNQGNGFYLFVGTLKKKRGQKVQNIKALNYCGMTTRSFGVRICEHEQSGRFDEFEGKVEIWLGKCEQPANPDESTLRRAEAMLIKGWDIQGNKQGKISFPAPTCLVMRWYFRNWHPRKRRPDFIRDSPDILWFEDEMLWTGKLKTKSAN